MPRGRPLVRALALGFLLLSSLSVPAAADPLDDGLRALERGAFDEGVARFTEALRAAEATGDPGRQARALVYLARARAALGQYRQAIDTLQDALKQAERAGDRALLRTIGARLGEALVAVGPPETAGAVLEQSLGLAREAGDTALAAAALNGLGNLRARQARWKEAADAYREAALLAERTGRPALAARAHVNAAGALRRAGAGGQAPAMLDAARAHLAAMPPSHDTAFALVGLGVAARELRAALPGTPAALTLQAAADLEQAGRMADGLGDRRTASYAWGYLGTLYEDERRWPEALRLTRRAVLLAQQAGAPESLYRWQWQAARLLRQTGSRDDAIAAYRRAVQTLDGIRPELAAGYDVAVTTFRESVGPLYFELVDQLLQRAGATADGGPATALLEEARDVVELLKVAELRDYFRDDCVETARAKLTRLDEVSPSAAVVYPVILSDRTELLVTLPSGLRRVVVPVTEVRMTAEVRQFRRALERRTTRQFMRPAQQLYSWLIRPLDALLAEARIDTLVFVPDGPLRTVPMGALHDGRQYLVAKYGLAITPGLTLTAPRSLDRTNLEILAVGLTQAIQGFPPLPEVAAELATIRELFAGAVLIDEEFSVANLESRLRAGRISILHVASHGEFGGTVDRTFLLAWDQRLTIDRLDRLVGLFKYRDTPLELLTLSACDTAEGDDRAALGLAGVAIKAGARSAVATLWNINDRASADLIAHFYRALRTPGVSRAAALQRAQLELLADPRYTHPGFWSPFLLINNWL
jgi:CHAT domain-containing protein